MPESITIFFNPCGVSTTMYPGDIDAPRKCEEALEELIDYLESHHISYFHRYLNNDEMELEEERLEKSGAREIAV